MTAMATQQDTRTGLFLACYEVGGDKPGAPLLTLHLIVYTPGEQVRGFGHITQTTNPPLDLATKLDGSFTYMTVMPNTSHILVTATGYPPIHWPRGGGLGPVIPPNLELQMVLDDNWKSGTANYKYSVDIGTWQSVTGAPVKAVSCTMVQ